MSQRIPLKGGDGQDARSRLARWPKRTIWFWRPSWYWFGALTQLPVSFAHDEYARSTVVLGWTITGRVIIATGWCRDMDCVYSALAEIHGRSETGQ